MTENEMTVLENQSINRDLSVTRDPNEVLLQAKKAAMVLADVIKNKKKPVLFNGEQYLEYEDWATVARFYNVTAKIVDTRYVQFGNVQGFESRAVAFHGITGQEISCAESMCLNDEDNWSTRPKYEWKENEKTKVGDVSVPLFQLRSMAQTRACAKVLRNVFSWVVVLAGFKPTPAEEMTAPLQTTDVSKELEGMELLQAMIKEISRTEKKSEIEVISEATEWKNKKTGETASFSDLSYLRADWQLKKAIEKLKSLYPNLQDSTVKMPEKKIKTKNKTTSENNLISNEQFKEWQKFSQLSTHTELVIADKLIKAVGSSNPKKITTDKYLELIEWLQEV